MEKFQRSITIKAPIETVFHFHDDTRNLLKITPPNIKVTIEHATAPGLGQIVELKVRQFGFLTSHMKMQFVEYNPPTLFSDRQLKGPFKSMFQRRILSEKNGETTLTDIFEYELPFGWLGKLAHTLFVRKQIEEMFTYRQEMTKRILEADSRKS